MFAIKTIHVNTKTTGQHIGTIKIGGEYALFIPTDTGIQSGFTHTAHTSIRGLLNYPQLKGKVSLAHPSLTTV